MTIHRLDEVLEAAPPKPRHVGLPVQTGANAAHDPCGRGPLAVSSVRMIPRPCSCTWRLRLGADEATWSLTQTDPLCRMHGDSSDEKDGAER